MWHGQKKRPTLLEVPVLKSSTRVVTRLLFSNNVVNRPRGKDCNDSEPETLGDVGGVHCEHLQKDIKNSIALIVVAAYIYIYI